MMGGIITLREKAIAWSGYAFLAIFAAGFLGHAGVIAYVFIRDAKVICP